MLGRLTNATPGSFTPTVAAVLVSLPLAGLQLSCSGERGGSKPPRINAENHYQRCATTEDNLRPLLVEWPSTQRSALEAELHRSDSMIVVRYTGCEMEVLRGCTVAGGYQWTEVSHKHDEIEIRNTGDVWAKIPLAAAKLVSAVERYGALHLNMQLVGQYAGPASAPDRAELQGRQCEAATHVVSSLMVGAFEITSATGGGFEVGVEVQGAGAGASAARHEGYYSSDGQPQSCRDASGYGAYGPSEACKSLLQIELLPLEASTAAAGFQCPPDMALIETHDDKWFCLDQHEVTVREYSDCAADHTCSEAPSTVDWPGVDDDDHKQLDELCNRDQASRRNHPVNCVTWDQAASYCRSRGKRLPLTSEWLWAARGGEQNRTYPWGEDTPSHRHVNACGKECENDLDAHMRLYDKPDGHVGTAPVGSFPAGTARWNLIDVAGNVWEWTDFGGYGGNVVCGGSARSQSEQELTSESAREVPAGMRSFDIGIRCAADATPIQDSKRRSPRR